MIYSFVVLVMQLFSCTHAINNSILPTPQNTTKIIVERVVGLPFEDALDRVNPEQRAAIVNFEASIPEAVPEHAFIASIFLNDLPPSDEAVILELTGDTINTEVGFANPSSMDSALTLICLLNDDQVRCKSNSDVLEIYLPPKTVAFAAIEVEAQARDQITFLIVPPDEPQRFFPGTHALRVFVEEKSTIPASFVDAPIHEKILGGCDFVTFITDASHSENLLLPGRVTRAIPFSLLIQLCDNPSTPQYFHLVPIADHTRVLSLTGDVWNLPVRLTNATTLIPINTDDLGDIEEFQVVLLPLSEELSMASRYLRVTRGIEFVR